MTPTNRFVNFCPEIHVPPVSVTSIEYTDLFAIADDDEAVNLTFVEMGLTCTCMFNLRTRTFTNIQDRTCHHPDVITVTPNRKGKNPSLSHCNLTVPDTKKCYIICLIDLYLFSSSIPSELAIDLNIRSAVLMDFVC